MNSGNVASDECLKGVMTAIPTRRRKDDYLKELMRDNTQLLINKIWEVKFIDWKNDTTLYRSLNLT